MNLAKTLRKMTRARPLDRLEAATRILAAAEKARQAGKPLSDAEILRMAEDAGIPLEAVRKAAPRREVPPPAGAHPVPA